jgi:heme O synthase-like polyprenyltransferase
MSSDARPAFYALAPGSWRDYLTLLHLPYTAWHLSYVAIGASLAPRMDWQLLGLTTLAFFLAMGIGAHALDELNGRPLGTQIADRTLIALALAAVAGAIGIGVAVAVQRTLWLLVFIVVGAFLVVAYNLELLGGRFHTDVWFGLAWGGFPLLTGYFAAAERVRADAAVAAVFAVVLSLAQRTLSHQVRSIRRQAESVNGEIVFRDGRRDALSADALTRAPELALKLLVVTTLLLAGSLLLHRAI